MIQFTYMPRLNPDGTEDRTMIGYTLIDTDGL
jgi:hypothetical protein